MLISNGMTENNNPALLFVIIDVKIQGSYQLLMIRNDKDESGIGFKLVLLLLLLSMLRHLKPYELTMARIICICLVIYIYYV